MMLYKNAGYHMLAGCVCFMSGVPFPGLTAVVLVCACFAHMLTALGLILLQGKLDA